MTENDTYVDRPGKPRIYVKNLGWLRRHWKEVVEFKVTHEAGTREACSMVAVLKDGGQYRTTWASWALMLGWLNRSIFQDLPITHFRFAPILNVNDVPLIIGSPAYKLLCKEVDV